MVNIYTYSSNGKCSDTILVKSTVCSGAELNILVTSGAELS